MDAINIDQRPWEKIHAELGVNAPAPATVPLGARIAEAARRIPDKYALYFEGVRFSFAWLESEANKLANALSKQGVGKGDVIGLYTPNLPQFVVALVAASKVGAIASGISSLLTTPELEFQLRDSETRVLIALDNFAMSRVAAIEKLPETLSMVIVTAMTDYLNPGTIELPMLTGSKVRRYLDVLDGEQDSFEQVRVAPQDCFLLQYTGGTTGTPKGAMLSVATVMTNGISGNIYMPYIYGEERMASAFPLFHIGGVMGLIGAIAAGGEYLIVANPRDVEKFIDQIIDMRPTRVGAVPTFYQMLMNHPRLGEIDFSALKCAVTGGAPITAADRALLDTILGVGKLSDVFGMTETCSMYVTNPPTRPNPLALGVPVPGADIRIIDTETGAEIREPGQAGEIITSGLHVMLGYKNRPGETNHVLKELDGRLWMHTGDVGYLDDEGYLFISDRAKDMLIVGGFKVFSLEVESKLKDLGFIAASALIGTPDMARPGNDIVNLFVQLTDTARAENEDDLRERIMTFCRTNLAPYKIPRRIFFIDAIPLTNVGKIDKKALRAIAIAE